MFDAIFVLSLRTSRARRFSIETQFIELGAQDYRFVDGVDGNTLDLAELKETGTLANSERTRGELGCYLTHVKAYREIVERGYDTALVCEDDVVFAGDANQAFGDIMTKVPPDWDIIHFWSSRPIGSGSPQDLGREQVAPGIFRGCDEGGGAVCYALTRRCANYLLSLAFPIKYAIDGVTNWPTGPWTSGYNGYVVWPFPCKPGLFESEIDRRGRRWLNHAMAPLARLARGIAGGTKP